MAGKKETSWEKMGTKELKSL